MAPAPGDPAPDFALADDSGAIVRLRDLRGRRVVLYAYPADDTPGCTRQACALRDSWPEIAATGAAVYGLSPDDVASHVAFRAKFSLPFPLLADPDRELIDALGFWGVRPNGTTGVIRSTVLIDADGVIERVWHPIDPDAHLELLRDALGP